MTKAIMQKTLFGHGETMDQFYTRSSPRRLQGVPKWERSVAEAKRLLKEAGIKPSTRLTMIGYVRYNYLEEGAQVYLQNLREIGLSVDLKIHDRGALSAARKSRQWDIMGLGSATAWIPMRTTSRR